jgi:NDP-sugar pyrophosphorylase family protein
VRSCLLSQNLSFAAPMTAFAPQDFLALDRCAHRVLFEHITHVWEALGKIGNYLQFSLKPGVHGELIGQPFIGENVFIGEGTVVEHGAMIKGPAWIGSNCCLRSGCYIRENVIVGDGATLGNSCEFKNCLIFDGAQVPHFNYVGDSILGHKSHLGAGVILSNVKLDSKEIYIETEMERIPTGLRKFGAILGDHAEVGCNAVLNPGSIIGRRSVIYPGAQWRGVLPANSIAKYRQNFSIFARRD